MLFAALEAGCEGIAAINTIQSVMGVNLDTLRPEPSVEGYTTPGGYSCKAVKPIALAKVRIHLMQHDMVLARLAELHELTCASPAWRATPPPAATPARLSSPLSWPRCAEAGVHLMSSTSGHEGSVQLRLACCASQLTLATRSPLGCSAWRASWRAVLKDRRWALCGLLQRGSHFQACSRLRCRATLAAW